MSALAPFVRALRALGIAIANEAEKKRLDGMVAEDNGEEADVFAVQFGVLGSLSDAVAAAATDLEQQIAADIARMNRIGEG